MSPVQIWLSANLLNQIVLFRNLGLSLILNQGRESGLDRGLEFAGSSKAFNASLDKSRFLIAFRTLSVPGMVATVGGGVLVICTNASAFKSSFKGWEEL